MRRRIARRALPRRIPTIRQLRSAANQADSSMPFPPVRTKWDQYVDGHYREILDGLVSLESMATELSALGSATAEDIYDAITDRFELLQRHFKDASMSHRVARRALPRRMADLPRRPNPTVSRRAGDLASELEQTLEQMFELLTDAKRIMRKVQSLPGADMIAGRAYSYWVPALTSYLDPEAAYSTRAMVTPMNTVQELNDLAAEEGIGRDYFEADEDDT